MCVCESTVWLAARRARTHARTHARTRSEHACKMRTDTRDSHSHSPAHPGHDKQSKWDLTKSKIGQNHWSQSKALRAGGHTMDVLSFCAGLAWVLNIAFESRNAVMMAATSARRALCEQRPRLTKKHARMYVFGASHCSEDAVTTRLKKAQCVRVRVRVRAGRAGVRAWCVCVCARGVCVCVCM